MNKKVSSQDGQTILEKLAVIMVMAIILTGVYRAYCLVTDKASSRNMSKELNARIVQLRHQALTSKGIQSETEEQAIDRALATKKGSNIPIRVQVSGANFTLVVGTQDYPLELEICENVLKEYQTNNQQCFVSGFCEESSGTFKFSTHCTSDIKNPSADLYLNCGDNAVKSAFGCTCDKGYENWKEGFGCSLIELDCGSNAHQSGITCVCDDGYIDWIEGDGCALVPLDCGLNAYQDGSECVCDDGYENWVEGQGCSLTILQCDTNGYQDGIVCICKAGYYGDGETCTLCGDGQYSIDGDFSCSMCSEGKTHNATHTGCICKAGYYGNGETCALCGARQYSVNGSASCTLCPAGQTHNSNHTGCQNCPVSTTLGDCGCSADEVPNGNGGCQPACTSYANSSTTVRDGYQISGTSCYCLSGYTLNLTKTACEIENTCAPGVCMTCTNGSAVFKPSGTSCEQSGVSGRCTAYGQCIPSGTSCSSATACPSGYFCNYGGTYGNYSQGYTPNICEKITAQTKTINGVTYYYNTLSDLKSWCRPADGGKNCTWGYLAWYGADSWCKSQGKRLLTISELQSVRTSLAANLPNATNTYWCSDGSVNISNGSTGSLNRKDGYANAGAVVCR